MVSRKTLKRIPSIYQRLFKRKINIPLTVKSQFDQLVAEIRKLPSFSEQRILLLGDSSKGRTLAAYYLATNLSLPLYRIDLAFLTSKYIGETEKNLNKLFSKAERKDSILLFDEADSLFGKRTDVSDAHDRFENQNISYLLQRIEEFQGLVLLASNLRDGFDEAFVRRLNITSTIQTDEDEEEIEEEIEEGLE